MERIGADLEAVTVGALDAHEQDEVLALLATLEAKMVAAEDSVKRDGDRPLRS